MNTNRLKMFIPLEIYGNAPRRKGKRVHFLSLTGFIAFILFLILPQVGRASFETKVILVDPSHKLIAIDKGSDEGLRPNTYFYIYRDNQFIGEINVFKTSKQVAICEIKNLTEATEIRVNDRLIFLTEQERASLETVKKPTLTEIPSTEDELKSKAQKIAEEEALKRKLDEVLIKEKAKGIAEAVKTEKELARMKEEAEAIVKEVIEEKKKAKHIISFDFKDAEIKNIVKIICQEAVVNIVIPPDFPSLPITISLKDVEMENALDVILGLVNYSFLKENNIYKVVKLEEAEKKTVYKTFAPRYIQVDKLKTLISEGGLLSGEGKVVIDIRSNKFVVIELPPNMLKIEEVVKQVDVEPRQVNIEAKIIDVSLADTEKLGIEWTWVKPRDAVIDDTLKIGFTVDPVTSLGMGFFNYGTLNAAEIAVVLEALMKRERAKILSKPTITTLNNEEAKINVTTKVAYQQSTVTAPGVGPVITTIVWLEKEVEITFSVTPYITDSGDIIMKVEPVASLLQGWTSDDPATRYPLIMTRSATTQVMVRDGETLVIGGLITQELRETKAGIPVLSDIPILGIPFRKKTQEFKNIELIIFITPYIVPSEKEKPKG